MLSLSVLLQVLVLPLTGAIADRTGHKRQLLAALRRRSARSRTMAMFFVADERYLLGAALFVVANLCFGAATVVYYSWLPDLACPDERDAVSSRGWAFGYLGGALLLAVNLALFTLHDEPRPDRGRGGADLPGLGRHLVGRRSPSSASRCCATAVPGTSSPRRAAAARSAAASASSAPPCGTCGPTR